MISLSDYILEAKIHHAKPFGYNDGNTFKSDVYDDYKFMLLKSIAKFTSLKRNEESNDLWEEFLLTDKFVLKSVKKTNVGKNGNLTKPSKISDRVVSDNKEKIIEILLGRDNDKAYDNLDSLVNFIVSTDYKERSKERIKDIFGYFLGLCERKNITKKLYKIQPWFKSKIDTIIQ